MQTPLLRWSTNVLTLICLVMLFLIFTQKQTPDLSFLDSTTAQSFKTIFLSIILEAFPFVLLGVLVSGLLQMFVSEQTIRRMIPKNPVLGILFACLVGIIFPLCECGMIPVIRRLMRKGMPVYVAIVFILVGPIINPVVYASTYMAFRSRPEIAYSRMALAFIVALVIGLIIYKFFTSNPLRDLSYLKASTVTHQHDHKHNHNHNNHEHNHEHDRHVANSSHAHNTILHDNNHDHSHHEHNHDHIHPVPTTIVGRIFGVLGHASDEFFDMGKYLLFGAIITAIIQTLVNRDSLVSIGQGEFTSHLFMMALGFVLSLCSTSDAFVASSFTTTFSTGSLLTFLVFGPMLDIKSLLMLLSAFRTRFVLALSVLIIVVVLVCSLIFEKIVFP
ncbi:hypothetical protein SAMN03159341_101605 [Paenibacillus sp. 1_12]|uniref:permease n=1 Tax=Paenibacillus sp. 1_12 TaxID=1566278 RepID=UPI0008E63541|nr:permease [Paenibacillus sp. 1_12]SFK79493.1 hypothetical protein SAMN03159341_101605 [Paenibacillus sp. 1_12]